MKGKISQSLLLVCGLSVGAGYVVAGYVHYAKIQPPISPGSNVSENSGGSTTRVGSLDFNNPRILVGWVKNVFAAKITKEIGRLPEPDLPELPHLQYEAKVIYNIKGDASGTITLDFDVTEGGDLSTGSTYLLATRPWQKPGWYYMTRSPAVRTLISNDATLTNSQLLELVLKNDRTYELLNAYPNEILYGPDVLRNDTTNSFQSLSDEKRQAILAKFQELIPPRPVPEILPPPPPPIIPPRQPGPTFQENNWSTCGDHIDNDGNGLTDCADPSCAAFCPSQPAPAPQPPTPTPPPPSSPHVTSTISIIISPASPTISSAGTQQFSASVTGAGIKDTSVTWSTTFGTIDQNGFFKAPAVRSNISGTITAVPYADTHQHGSTTFLITAPSGATSTTP